MRRPVIAGNWKMYKTHQEAADFARKFVPLVAASTHCEIILAPPFTSIASVVAETAGSSITVAGQNGYWAVEGAFTGEVSMKMLVDAGCKAVILGHSERRQFFGDTDETVNRKAKAALEAGLTPIICVGESLAEREGSRTEKVLQCQCEGSLAALTALEISRILLAYEPVWAIGTGRTATPEIAAAAHKHIRARIAAQFTPERASALRILYGGSVKPDNIKGLMAQVEIDGALVGGASLDVQSFASIVNF
jgi:triosephosphate isomerase